MKKSIETEYLITMFLDTRREKSNGLYPLKLRIYANKLIKAKLYPTTFEFTEKDFESIWLTTKPRKEHQQTRKDIQAVITRAEETAEAIIPFSFEQFEKKLYRKAGDADNVFYHYALIIEKYKNADRFGTASNYELSLKSIKDFAAYSNNWKEPNKILFSQITPAWLERYESYMLKKTDKKPERSRTTVSMYLRALRTVFNAAIISENFDKSIYPFGNTNNGKYQVPGGGNKKKALSSEQLKQLFKAKPQTDEQAKAKDFWFFSYACNGMNIKDIALLKFKDFKGDKLEFIRAKTINTTKENIITVTVYLNEFSLSIIDKYGSTNKAPNNYIFNILSDAMNERMKFDKIKNFTRFINQNLKKLANAEGLQDNISTYWARHSFATISINKGASMEFVSEALSHSNLKTTKAYFAGFDNEIKKEFMQKIMNF